MNISHRIKLGAANIRQMRGSAYNATATHTHTHTHTHKTHKTHTHARARGRVFVCLCVLSFSGDYGGTFAYRKVNGKEMSLFFCTEIRNFIR